MLLATLLAVTASHWFTVLAFPYQLDFGEGPILDLAQTVARGELPYRAIDERPWNFSVYTPLFIAASGLLINLLPTHPWLAGRLISVVSSLLLGGLLVHYVVDRAPSRGPALVAGALWFASPFVAIWSVLFRVDLFSIMWSIAGFLLVDRAWRDDTPRLLVPAAIAMVLGFFSKQSLIAAPIAATLFLLWSRPRWLPWLVIPGVVGGAIGGGALWLVAGEAVVANLNVPSAHVYSANRLLSYQLLFWFLMAPAALVALRGLRLRDGGQQRLLSLYMLASLPVTLAVAKRGSELNYFLESLWLLLALAGLELMRRGAERPSLVAGTVLGQCLMFALATGALVVPASAPEHLDIRRDADETIRASIDALPPEALIYSEHMGVIAQGGRSLELDPLLYSQLAHEGYWDEAPLVRSLASGEAALLIQSRDAPVNPARRFVWTPALHDAAEIGYEIGSAAGEWSVRRPQPITLDVGRPIGSGISLRGWLLLTCSDRACSESVTAETPAGAERFEVHLLFESVEEQRLPLTVEVELLGKGGRPAVRAESRLRGGFDIPWPEGALLRHEQGLPLPVTAGAHDLALRVSIVRDGAVIGSAMVDPADARSTRR